MIQTDLSFSLCPPEGEGRGRGLGEGWVGKVDLNDS